MEIRLTEHEKKFMVRELELIKDYFDTVKSNGTLKESLASSSLEHMLCEVRQAITEPAKVLVMLGGDNGQGDYRAVGNVEVHWVNWELLECAKHGEDSTECGPDCTYLTDDERLARIPKELKG